MHFHGMKRKDLQNLCKKHGIPANLKNSEMATRLATVFQNEDEETIMEPTQDDTVEADGIKEELVACRKAKKVTFSPETDYQVFEFTRSLKKLQRKNVKTAKVLQQGGGIELRRSKRTVAKGITVARSSGDESKSVVVEAEKVCSSTDATKVHKVTRRSKRIGSSGSTQEEGKETDMIALEQFEDRDVQDGLQFEKVGRRSTRLTAKTAKESEEENRTMQSKRAAEVDSQEDELVKRKTKEPLTDYKVQSKVEVQDVSQVEMVTRRCSKRLCNKVNVSLVDGNVKAVKRDNLAVEKAPKQSKKLRTSTSELLVDGQVRKGDKKPKRTSGNDREDIKLLRRSKRTALDNRLGQAMSNSSSRCPVIDSERDGASVDNTKKLNVNDEMQVGVRFTRNYSENDSIKVALVVEENLVDKKTDETLVKSSKRVTRKMKRDRSAEPGLDRETASNQSNLTARKPLDENTKPKDETLIFTPTSELKENSSVAKLAIVEVRGNSAERCKEDRKGSLEKDVQAENLHVNISECNTENIRAGEMKIGKVGCINIGLTPEKLSDAYTQLVPEEGAGPNVETRSSSKKMKTMTSEFAIRNPQGMAEELSSTSGTKTTEPVMISENVLDSTSKVSVDISLVKNTVMMTATKKDKEEASLSEFLIERPEVNIPESELLVETTPPSTSVHSANRHGNLFEYNTENSITEEQSDICKVVHISAGHCVNRETLNEVNDDSLTKSERTISGERDCKPNALELSGSLSTDLTSFSPNEENVSECLEEDEMKTLSQPIPINKAASDALGRSSVFTTPERNLMLMVQLSESEEIRAVDTVSQHNDEAVESHAVVFTTPEQVLLLGDSGLDGVGKEEEHTATDPPNESDVLNTSQNEAINEEESIVVGFHDESNIAASQLRHSGEGDFKEDGIDRNEENRTIELHCESGTCISLNRYAILEDFLSDGAENSGGNSENKDVELLTKSNISINLGRHSLSGDYGLDGTKKIEDTAVTCEETFVFGSPERRHHSGNSESNIAGKEVEFKDESAFFTRLESRLLLGESGQDRLGDRKTGSSQYQSHHASSPKVTLKDGSVVWGSHVSTLDLGENTVAASSGSIASKVSYTHEFRAGEATAGADFMPKSFEAENVAGLDATQATSKESRGNAPHVDTVNIFNFEGANTIMDAERNASFNCYVLALPDKGNSKTMGEITNPLEVARTCPLVSEESSLSTNIQKQINDSLDEFTITVKLWYFQSFVERSEADELIESKVTKNSQRDYCKGNLMLDSSGGFSVSGKTIILGGTEDDPLGCNSEEDFRNTSEKRGGKILEDEASGPIATPIGKDISLTPNEFTVEDNIKKGLDATQGTSKQSRGHSPNASSVNLFDSDIDGTETAMESKRNVPFNSHVLALPAEGASETIGEISSHLEVGGTSFMVSGESAPSTAIQNQINDAMKELAETGGFSVSGKTSVLGGTEDEHLGYHSGVNFKSRYGKSGHKFLKDEATDPACTAFEKDISLSPDEFTLQKNRNQEDDDIVKGEATPSLEETLNESYEKRKEYVKIGELGTLSAKQVRREPILIYRTQVKSKKHDMKENALNSKIVDSLNVTAPRTSKRLPLKDLRKN